MDLFDPLRAPEYVGRHQVTRETDSEEQDQKRVDHNTARSGRSPGKQIAHISDED